MPKSKPNKSSKHTVLSVLKELLATHIFSKIEQWFKGLLHDIQDSIYLTARKILESFISVMIILFGIGMIVFGLPFILSYYLDLPASLFFIIIGLILIVIGVISLNHINKTKFKTKEE